MQAAERAKAAETKTPTQGMLTPASEMGLDQPLWTQENFEFDCKEGDNVHELFEIIGIKMDLHKTGILYLKELVLLLISSNRYILATNAIQVGRISEKAGWRLLDCIYEANAQRFH